VGDAHRSADSIACGKPPSLTSAGGGTPPRTGIEKAVTGKADLVAALGAAALLHA